MPHRKITVQEEIAIGRHMKACAIAAGHRPKLPPDMAVKQYAHGSLKADCLAFLKARNGTPHDIAIEYNLDRGHASYVVHSLVCDGLIVECDRVPNKRGRMVAQYAAVVS